VAAPYPTLEILGVPFARLTPSEALDRVEELFERAAPALVAYANVHTVNLAVADPGYASVLRRADLVLNDGKGVMLAARLYGKAFPADLNGNFFTPLLLRRAAARGWRAYFYGARPGVARAVADRLSGELHGLDVAGVSDGYAPVAADVVDKVRASGAQLLLVGLGNPRQERWLEEHLTATGARLGVGVGAFFDFQAGEVPRAPAWMNRVGLEWAHRLTHEPRRMWRRYLIGNPVFLARTARERLQSRAG
jgi:exopolysaccharide biosynthesis WecB/TagA/CpsF family protein